MQAYLLDYCSFGQGLATLNPGVGSCFQHIICVTDYSRFRQRDVQHCGLPDPELFVAFPFRSFLMSALHQQKQGEIAVDCFELYLR